MKINWKIVEFLSCLVIYGLIAFNLHEWGHYIVNRLGGGDGFITFPHFIDGRHWIVIQGQPVWLEQASGGLVVALVLGVLWYWAWRSPTHQDLNSEAALAFIALIQLVYGLTEGFLYTSNAVLWEVEAFVATVIGGGLGLWYYLPKLDRWWSDGKCVE